MAMSTKAVAAGAVLLAGLSLAPLAVTVPVSVQMIGQATVIIFIASFTAAERERQRQRDGDDAEERDVIKSDQAKRFPLVASGALFGMFLAFKYLPKQWVSIMLTLYGVGFGALAFATLLSGLLCAVPAVPKFLKKEYGYKAYFTLSLCDVLGLIVALPVAYAYYTTKHWLPNNVLACSLALSAVDALALGDFQSGVILLSGLFFYDIFWVFGSKSVFGDNVMVAVAKQFEGPIKLMFPRFVGADAKNLSMLGLGDIVIPGLFVALTLRFDTRKVKLDAPLPMNLPYFYTSMVAYVLGLVATTIALNVFNAAQPALLYLVPACLIACVGVAVSKGEMKELWAYTEEDETKPDKKTDEKTADDTCSESTDAKAAEPKPLDEKKNE